MKFVNYLLLERNILNTHIINNWIDFFLAHSEDYGRSEKISSWIKSNLKNYLLREYPNLNRVTHVNPDDMQPWVQKALDKKDLYDIIMTQDFRDQIYHVIDYFRANPDLNISRISVPEAIRQSERWTEELNKKASDKEDKTGLEEVRKYPDGFRWVKVTSAQSLDREGKLMKHCVGTYCDQVSSGSTTIYSLRDKKNEPHCTVEVRGSAVNQIKGKANGPVDDKYIKYVQDFVMKPVSGKQYTNINDLYNIGLMKVDNKYYDINNLPENLHVKGHLDFEESNIKSLPKGLKVGGSLDLNSCTGLTSLPEGLQVGGFLDLYFCTALTSLPKGLKVKYSLDLFGCSNLKALPEGLQVGENLDIRRCLKIRSLPEDLEVKGDIYVSREMEKYFKDSKFKDDIRA